RIRSSRICVHARTFPPSDQRTGEGESLRGDSGAQTQLRATALSYFPQKGMGQQIIRRSSSASLLAKALLRFQCVERAQTHRETTLHSQKSGQARIGGYSRSMEVEQFPSLCLRGDWTCGCE